MPKAKQVWLRFRGYGTAHLSMRRTGSNVESWCGVELDDSMSVLAKPTSRRCKHCIAYARHARAFGTKIE